MNSSVEKIRYDEYSWFANYCYIVYGGVNVGHIPAIKQKILNKSYA